MVILKNSTRESAKMGQAIDTQFQTGGDPWLAVDIGTTTVVVDLYTSYGELVATLAEDNAQGTYGSDVMMRLMHVKEGRGDLLVQRIREQIFQMGSKLICKWKSLFAQTVPVQMAVVGNTVMCHLFLQKDVTGLMGAPFSAAYEGCYTLLGKDVGWKDWNTLVITVLPGIAAHVGADAAAMLGNLRMWDADKIQLAVDLGTNAEILLNNRGTLYACSTAAGPAFEGRGISHGRRARAGVINAVKLFRGAGNIELTLVSAREQNDQKPIGICGSGLVDLLAALRRHQVMTSDGCLLSGEEAMQINSARPFADCLTTDVKGERQFVLYDDIVLTQQDIRSVQLAKAAIQSGMMLLLEQAVVSVEDIQELYVAGVFGGFVNPGSAKQMGLVPSIDDKKIIFVGNAAGKGAGEALCDPKFIDMLQEHIADIHHIELAEQAKFTQVYMDSMEIAPWH